MANAANQADALARGLLRFLWLFGLERRELRRAHGRYVSAQGCTNNIVLPLSLGLG